MLMLLLLGLITGMLALCGLIDLRTRARGHTPSARGEARSLGERKYTPTDIPHAIPQSSGAGDWSV